MYRLGFGADSPCAHERCEIVANNGPIANVWLVMALMMFEPKFLTTQLVQ